MRSKRYSRVLSSASWQVIEKIIQVRRRRKWDLKQIVNAILYVTKNGCVWRDVSGEFPPWQAVYYHAKWIKDGTWKNLPGRQVVFDGFSYVKLSLIPVF